MPYLNIKIADPVAPPIVGDPFYDQTMMLLQFETDLTDESALSQTFTAAGGAAASGGQLVLDGIDDGLLSDARPNDFSFLHSGAPFTIEWTSARGTNTRNTVFHTNQGGSARTGLFFSEESDGGLFVLMTNSVSGAPIIEHTFPAGTIPVGTAHKVIECNFGSHNTTVDVLRVGVDGVYVGGCNRNNVGVLTTPFTSPKIGVNNSNLYYQGGIDGLRVTHSLRYDLFSNATYTVPPEPMLAIQQPGFQMFTPQHYPLNDIDDGYISGMGYRAEPDLIHKSTPGHLLSIFHVGPSHNGNSTTVLAKSESTNYGRSWSPATTILSDPTLSVRSPTSFRASNGRIFVLANYQDAANTQIAIKMIYSDDDGATWSSEIDLTTGVFSASKPWVTFGLEETSQGLMLVVFTQDRTECEVAFTPVTGTPTFTAPVSVWAGATDLSEPAPVVCDLAGDQVVLIVRQNTVPNQSFASYKSADGGLSWVYSGEADWTTTSKLAPNSVGVKRLSDGRVIAAWNERDIRKRQYYSIMNEAAFFANPTDLWDVLASNPNIAYHECWGGSSTSNFGYPSIIDFGDGNIIISHYEGVDVSSTTTRIYNVPLQV